MKRQRTAFLGAGAGAEYTSKAGKEHTIPAFLRTLCLIFHNYCVAK